MEVLGRAVEILTEHGLTVEPSGVERDTACGVEVPLYRVYDLAVLHRASDPTVDQPVAIPTALDRLIARTQDLD